MSGSTLHATTAHRSFLAFDFGTQRVGVATGNTLTRSARPLRTIAAKRASPSADTVASGCACLISELPTATPTRRVP